MKEVVGLRTQNNSKKTSGQVVRKTLYWRVSLWPKLPVMARMHYRLMRCAGSSRDWACSTSQTVKAAEQEILGPSVTLVEQRVRQVPKTGRS